jgi:outer membrane protein OmpA-like peptidoglycan-associated protein
MRRSALLRAVSPVLVCLAAVLWLVYGFLNVSALLKGVLTVAACIMALLMMRRRYRHQRPITAKDESGIYLPEGFTGPVLLVCGDLRDSPFAEKACRTTAQGCYLPVGGLENLSAFADRLLVREPAMAGQLVVMFRLLPDGHEDEGLLRATLKVLRQQVRQLKNLSGYTPPVVLVGEFSGPETPWIVVRGKTSLVCPVDEPALVLDEWGRLAENVARLPYLTQAMSLLQQVVMDALSGPDRLCSPVAPFAVALRSGAVKSTAEALWPQWLFRHSALQPSLQALAYPSLWHFPDPVLPLLAPFTLPLQGAKTGRRVVVVLFLCALAAMGLSAMHNQSLIGRIGSDLQRWYAIPMSHYAPKAQSLHALQQDALLLERWQRQGEPQRYGLGLYTGERLWLAVQQAIDTYVPAPAPVHLVIKKVVQGPKIVRLDSMSLFDTGRWQLKPGSTKVLVNALVDIKAKQGWLIVVSGYTDNTGDDRSNQALSLKRAESVRDWMRDTGDVPESCFAVQGYGENRPAATNDTPEGRALNRRVEISLVPQADACQAPDKQSVAATGDINKK